MMVGMKGRSKASKTWLPPAAPVVAKPINVTSVVPPTFEPGDPDHQITLQLLAENNDVVSGRTVTYESSDTGVVTVTAGGLVHAVGVGTATVTLRAEGISTTIVYTVTVPIATVTQVILNTFTASVQTGGAVFVSAIPKDVSSAAVLNQTVTWAIISGSGNVSLSADSGPESHQVTVSGLLVGSATIRATCNGINSGDCTITVTAPIGSSFDPANFGMTHVIGRHYNTKATSNGDRGTGSLPFKTGGSEGFDGIEFQYNNISIQTDVTAPLSASNVMRFRYPAQTVSSGTFTPGTSQTLDFNNSLYTGLNVASTKWFYVKFGLKLSSNFWGNPTSTNKMTFFRAGPTSQSFEPIFRFRGVDDGPLVVNVDLQGSEGVGGDPRATTGGLNPNLSGASGAGAFNLPRGVWHIFEILLYTGTPGNGDGELHIWMNGTKTHEYPKASDPTGANAGIRFHKDALGGVQQFWRSWHQDPTWGGGVGTIPATMDMFMDDIDIWLKA